MGTVGGRRQGRKAHWSQAGWGPVGHYKELCLYPKTDGKSFQGGHLAIHVFSKDSGGIYTQKMRMFWPHGD